MHQTQKSRDQSGTWLKSTSARYLLQFRPERHWWKLYPSSSLSIAKLSCCRTAWIGYRSSGRYLHQRFKSRDQFGTWLKSISAIDLLQIGLERHWWKIHPPSSLNFTSLSCCRTAWFGYRSSGRYLYQS